MSKTVFNTIEELENHIKATELKRKIDVEKLKFIKNQFAAELRPYRFAVVGLKMAQRYGLFYLVRKFLK